MARFPKWIDDVSADDTVRTATIRSLRQRLDAVQYYLPLAAHRSSEDVEYVHQLRVSTRRSMAAITLYRGLMPGKASKWLDHTLRQIRKTAGDARDTDVMIERYGGAEGKGVRWLLTFLREQRKQAQSPIARMQRSLCHRRLLEGRIDGLLDTLGQIDSPIANARFGDWSRARLGHIVDRFFGAAPTRYDDLAGLHRFRIAGKQLRYAIELLASALPDALRNDVYPQVEEVQERLGTINDHAVAATCLRQWKRHTKSPRKRLLLDELADRECLALAACLPQFAQWWPEGASLQLQEGLQGVLGRPNRLEADRGWCRTGSRPTVASPRSRATTTCRS